MIIIDSLLIYEDLDKRKCYNEALIHFNKVLRIIKTFGIGLSFKQALLLIDYENEAYNNLYNFYYNIIEPLPQALENQTPSIKELRSMDFTKLLKANPEHKDNSKKIRTLQKELRIIDTIREANKSLLTGGCNCE